VVCITGLCAIHLLFHSRSIWTLRVSFLSWPFQRDTASSPSRAMAFPCPQQLTKHWWHDYVQMCCPLSLSSPMNASPSEEARLRIRILSMQRHYPTVPTLSTEETRKLCWKIDPHLPPCWCSVQSPRLLLKSVSRTGILVLSIWSHMCVDTSTHNLQCVCGG